MFTFRNNILWRNRQATEQIKENCLYCYRHTLILV